MPRVDAERFWDERARENALYFVDNDLNYERPDETAFWGGGDDLVDRLFAAVELQLDPKDSVLDIGCGVGRTTRALARRVDRVIAIDVSGEMLARAEALNPHLANVKWMQGDGSSLRPLEGASVDGCFSWVVFQHIPDQQVIFSYIEEMARVLRPGGWTVFQVSMDPRVHARPRLRHRLKATVGLAPGGQDHPAWRGSSVGLEELRRVIDASGLELHSIAGPNTQYATVRAHRRIDASARDEGYGQRSSHQRRDA